MTQLSAFETAPASRAPSRRIVRYAISVLSVVATAGSINVALISTASAYIDPGTGTMILQVAGALIASALFYLRSIRLWIAAKLGLGRPGPSGEAAESAVSANRPGDE